MAYGLLSTGLNLKTQEIILDGWRTTISDEYGASVDTSDPSPLGQLLTIFAAAIAEAWELGEAVYNGSNPDANTGAAQDAIAAITGTTRVAAAPSTVTGYLIGDDATVIAAGSQASVTATEDVFATDAEVTLALADTWATGTAYSVGDVVSNTEGADACWYCITAGTSAGTGNGPDTTAVDVNQEVTDNTAEWYLLGLGLAYVTAAMTCTVDGPTICVTRTLKQIETPISGWNSITNVASASVGNDNETDEALRIRRETELTTAGSSPEDALRADLLAVDSVTAVKLFVNNTDATDGDGLPPHSVEAVVLGGDDQDIVDQLLASVAAGIQTYGTSSGTATDSEGTDHTIYFTRPTEVPIYFDITLTYDALEYPADGDDLVDEALVDHGNELPIGQDVTSWYMTNVLGALDIGILDVTAVDMGTAPSPSGSATISISTRQIATFVTANVNVTSSAATP